MNNSRSRASPRKYLFCISIVKIPGAKYRHTEDDVVLIKQVLDLLDQGISISQVKPMLEQTSSQQQLAPFTEAGEVWKTYQQKMLGAVERFDEHLLDSTYKDALSLYPVDVVNQRLVSPLLRIIGFPSFFQMLYKIISFFYFVQF